MAHHIHELNEEIRVNTERAAEEARENFERDTTLTEEEKTRLEEISHERETIVREVAADGTELQIPLDDFTKNFDAKVKEINTMAGEMAAKAVHVGDIKRTVEDVKKESREKAVTAFKNLAVTDVTLSDDEIVEINDEAIAAVQAYLKIDKLDSAAITKQMKKLSLNEMAAILPQRFTSLYTLPHELASNNYKAKERLLTTLAYLSVTGPEMDYLNDYIDHENKLMVLSNRIVECQMDMVKVLEDKERMSAIVAKADEISPQDRTSVWAKYINDPKAVHNEFAQLAVMETILKESYEKIYAEYQDDPECCAKIAEQIHESEQKHDVYLSVTNIELLWQLWSILTNRFKMNRKNNYQNLRREGIAALDRCRRSKLDVHFPVYDPNAAKNPENLFILYMTQYPNMLAKYNETVRTILEKGEEDSTGITPIEIEGIQDETVYEYFSLLLLILFGRVMKKLTSNDMTRYDAIELDVYFKMYCKLGRDVYLMTKVWSMCKDFVAYAIQTWPKESKKPKG